MVTLNWNIFRLCADASHAASKGILIFAIHSNASAEGVSLVTQLLYLAIFAARYVPGLWWSPWHPLWHNLWNLTLKIFYIASSAYTIFLMARVYPHTRERDLSRKLGIWAAGAALALAPLIMMIVLPKRAWSFYGFADIFSLALESVCVVPQLLLLRETSVPTVLDSFYLVTLGSYRAFYLLNWLVEGLVDHTWPPVSIVFGLLQTALYIDFAWVYWTRQRVKLRGGTVVDSDDLRKGWLLGRFVRRGGAAEDADEEAAPHGRGAPTNKWGARGISVSADEGLRDEDRMHDLTDPDEFEDEPSDAERVADVAAPAEQPRDDVAAAVGNGSEWQDDGVSK